MKKGLLLLLCLPMIGFGQADASLVRASFGNYSSYYGKTDVNVKGKIDVNIKKNVNKSVTIRKTIKTIDYRFGQHGSSCELIIPTGYKMLLFLYPVQPLSEDSVLYASDCGASLYLHSEFGDKLDESVRKELDGLGLYWEAEQNGLWGKLLGFIE